MIEIDSTHQPLVVEDLDADWLLALCEDTEIESRRLERKRLRLALQWARMHPADPHDAAKDHVEHVGGPGTPAVEELSTESLAAALGMTAHAGLQLVSDALDLHYRLPLTWARVEALEVPAWRARRIAQATSKLSVETAAAVDALLAPKAHKCGTRAIDTAIAEATHVEEQAAEEALGRANWDVQLFHGPMTGPGRWAGTSTMVITGDTLDLTHVYDLINTEATRIDTDDPIEVRRAMAVGNLARRMNGGKPPRVRLYLHADLADLADDTIGTGSVERLGPLTMSTIKDWAGHAAVTSTMVITGDTLDLTHVYDLINTEATRIDTDDPIEVRRAMAVGNLARRMNGGKPPRVRLYLHADLADLADDTIGTGSVERLGPLTMSTIKDWAGHAAVTVLPVLRTDRDDAVDQHDPPAWMRELVILRDQHCVHPYCQTDARACDLDHIIEYLEMCRGGPPGQTHPGNLAPLCRRHHRAKTRRRWRYHRQPDGSYLWTGPHGRRYRVDHDGTVPLPPV